MVQVGYAPQLSVYTSYTTLVCNLYIYYYFNHKVSVVYIARLVPLKYRLLYQIQAIQCYPDPFDHDAHMGLPDKYTIICDNCCLSGVL